MKYHTLNAYKQQKFISQCSGGLKSRVKTPTVRCRISSRSQTPRFIFTWWKWGLESCHRPLCIWALTSSMRAPLSWSRQLQKAPPPNNIHAGGRTSIYEFWSKTNIQIIADIISEVRLQKGYGICLCLSHSDRSQPCVQSYAMENFKGQVSDVSIHLLLRIWNWTTTVWMRLESKSFPIWLWDYWSPDQLQNDWLLPC